MYRHLCLVISLSLALRDVCIDIVITDINAGLNNRCFAEVVPCIVYHYMVHASQIVP